MHCENTPSVVFKCPVSREWKSWLENSVSSERFHSEMEGLQRVTIGDALEAIRVGNSWTRVTSIVLDSLSPAVAESVRRHLAVSEPIRSILETAAASNPERFATRSSDPWPWHHAPQFEL